MKPEKAGVETLFKVLESGSKYVRLYSKSQAKCMLAAAADGSIVDPTQVRDDEKSQFQIKVMVRCEEQPLQ